MTEEKQKYRVDKITVNNYLIITLPNGAEVTLELTKKTTLHLREQLKNQGYELETTVSGSRNHQFRDHEIKQIPYDPEIEM